MSTNSTRRALIVLAVFLLCILVGGRRFYYWQNRPLPPMVSPVPGRRRFPARSRAFSASFLPMLRCRLCRRRRVAQVTKFAACRRPGPRLSRTASRSRIRRFRPRYRFRLQARSRPRRQSPCGRRAFGTPANVLGDDRVLSIADGRFDQQKIKSYALRTGRATTSGAHEVLEVPGNPPVSVEFLSPTRIALASGKNAVVPFAAINAGGSVPRDPVLQSRIERVAGAPIFAVARTAHLPVSFYANFHNAPQLEALIRSIQALTLAGQPDGNNLRVGARR